MSDTLSEVRSFNVDKNIIYDLIFKQHYGIDGALTELIQNSVDAEADVIEITCDGTSFCIKDNGKGFASKKEITDWFEVFGAPHKEENLNRFGRFRMGRGQIMGIASTTWRSGSFKMHVDVKERGLDYELLELTDYFQGCKIHGRFYPDIIKNESHFLDPKDCTPNKFIERIKKSVKNKCKYIFKTKILFNGEQININDSDIDWTYEDEDMYFLIEKKHSDIYNSVSVYNLGIHIDHIRGLGLNGKVITKKHLSLNMTRSQIQSTCALIGRIKEKLRSFKPKFNATKNYGPEKAKLIVKLFMDDELGCDEFIYLKIFQDAFNSKAHYSLNDISQKRFTFYDKQNFHGKTASHTADFLDQSGSRLVLKYDPMVGAWEKKKKDEYLFSTVINKVGLSESRLWSNLELNFRWIDECASEVDQDNILLKREQLTDHEKAVLSAIKSGIRKIEQMLRIPNENKSGQYSRSYNVNDRRLRIWNLNLVAGISHTASAWTNSKTYIAIEKQQLDLLKDGMSGALQLGFLTLHELCHVMADTEQHDREFYKVFHDNLVGRSLAWVFAKHAMVKYDIELAKAKLRPSKKLAREIATLRPSAGCISAKAKPIIRNTKE
ncbi:MAG: hypothetical protein C9356_20370 [Oleiphilus sp.]|nr:MAG: hypothetical protein C9356_20370 [Oleiphilus sp.]